MKLSTLSASLYIISVAMLVKIWLAERVLKLRLLFQTQSSILKAAFRQLCNQTLKASCGHSSKQLLLPLLPLTFRPMELQLMPQHLSKQQLLQRQQQQQQPTFQINLQTIAAQLQQRQLHSTSCRRTATSTRQQQQELRNPLLSASSNNSNNSNNCYDSNNNNCNNNCNNNKNNKNKSLQQQLVKSLGATARGTGLLLEMPQRQARTAQRSREPLIFL